MNEVDKLLEHYGKKGMHWGFTTSVSGKAVNTLKPKKQKLLLGKKKKIGNVSIDVGFVDSPSGRNAIIQALLVRQYKKKLKDIAMNQQRATEAKNLIEEHKAVKV